MRMLATTEQMRELDRTAIEERGIPSLELMENAARAVAQAAADLVGPVKEQSRPDGVIGSAVSVAFIMTGDSREPTAEEQRELDEIRAVVESKNTDPTQRIGIFCGPGNNGGDGIAAARILLEEGYIKNFQLIDDGTQGVIRVTLKYGAGKEKVISGLRRVSKPGLRVYAGADELPKVLRGLGIAIVSTSKGVMTDKKAREAHVGGEVLAFVW